MPAPISLKLPATSANLGPGFDALGLAMNFHLHITAREAEAFSIRASGRNAEVCGDVQDSLVLDTYRSVLQERGTAPVPLHLDLRNEIPLGMGCGSSAAALVAGVALANHFGQLGWTAQEILTDASVREGHPDNTAACVLGGLTISAMRERVGAQPEVAAVSVTPGCNWPLVVVVPGASLSTKKARALLPESYSKADAIANVQRVGLLTAAFAQGRGDLLAVAMEDRMHQPYRAPVCPLLQALLPLSGTGDVLGVALSGAGPSVLLILREGADRDAVRDRIAATLGSLSDGCELLETEISSSARV